MTREMHYTNRWAIGQWQFFEIDGRQIIESYAGRTLFGYEVQTEDGARPEVSKVREWFNTLEHAMAAAIAEKYTGPRSAGGTGVGTAADWFMRMIGADQVIPVNDQAGRKALTESIYAANGFPPVGPDRFADRIADQLEARGLVLAALNHGK